VGSISAPLNNSPPYKNFLSLEDEEHSNFALNL
jgi:hypothetical protein